MTSSCRTYLSLPSPQTAASHTHSHPSFCALPPWAARLTDVVMLDFAGTSPLRTASFPPCTCPSTGDAALSFPSSEGLRGAGRRFTGSCGWVGVRQGFLMDRDAAGGQQFIPHHLVHDGG